MSDWLREIIDKVRGADEDDRAATAPTESQDQPEGSPDDGGVFDRIGDALSDAGEEVAAAHDVRRFADGVAAVTKHIGEAVENVGESLPNIGGLGDAVRNVGDTIEHASHPIADAGERAAAGMVRDAAADVADAATGTEARTPPQGSASASAPTGAAAAPPSGGGPSQPTTPTPPTAGTSSPEDQVASPEPATASGDDAAAEPGARGAVEDLLNDEEFQQRVEEARRQDAERFRQMEEQASDLESDAETLHEAVRDRMAEAVELSGTRDRLIRERESVVARRDAASDAARDELQRAQDLLRRVDELREQADEATKRGDLRAAEEAREDAETTEDLARTWTERAARTQVEADELSDQATELRESAEQADQAFDEARAEGVLWEAGADQMEDKAAKFREAIEHYERGRSLQEELDAFNSKMGTDEWNVEGLERITNAISEAVEAERQALADAENIRVDPRVLDSEVLRDDENAPPAPDETAGDSATEPLSGVGTSPSITDDVVAPDDGGTTGADDAGPGPLSGVGTSPSATERDTAAGDRSPAALRAQADRLEEQAEALGRGKGEDAAHGADLVEKAKLLDQAADLRERSDRFAREAEALSARGQSAAANQKWRRAEEAHQAAQQTVARAEQIVDPAVEAAVISGAATGERPGDDTGPAGDGEAAAGEQPVTMDEDPFAIEEDVADAPAAGDAPVDALDGDAAGLDVESDAGEADPEVVGAPIEPAPTATDPLDGPGEEPVPEPIEVEMEPLEVSVPGTAEQPVDTLGPDPGLESDDPFEPPDDLSDGM